jgi:hypothetical protein
MADDPKAASPEATERFASNAPMNKKLQLFSVVSWGCAATHWLGKVLNAHPEILCMHAGNSAFRRELREEFSDQTYLEVLLRIAAGYSAVGDVHGIARHEIPRAKEKFGPRFTAVVVVRDPMPRMISQLAHFSHVIERGRQAAYDLSYVQELIRLHGIDVCGNDEVKMFFLHGANMLNAIIEEQHVGKIYRYEDVTKNPVVLAELVLDVTGGTVQPSPEWIEQILHLAPVVSHRRGTETSEFGDWETDVLRKVVDPKAWALYANLGYEIPAFILSA